MSYPIRFEGDVLGTESCLCSIAQAEDDLTPYLDHWARNETLESVLSLSGFLLQSAVALSRDTGRNPFWNERDQQYQQLKRWVYSSDVTRKLDAALDRWSDTDCVEELHAALAIVTRQA